MVRVLTASFLLVLLGLALWLGPLAYAGLLAVVVWLAWREFVELATAAGARPLRSLGTGLALGCALSFLAPQPAAPLAAFAAASLLAGIAALFAGRQHPALAVRRAIATIGGCVWLGLLPGFQLAILALDGGTARGDNVRGGTVWVVFLFAAVSAGDVAAYYGGSLLGRRPLARALSPSKTIEGTLCGLLASVAGAAVVSLGWLPGRSLPRALAVGLLLGAVGQAGDLFESSLKRAAGTKDASGLLPGHGGVLDRVDGLLFAGAALYIVLFLGFLRP